MPRVTLTYPALGDAQTIEVDELSLPHYKRAGWRVVCEKTDAPAPTTSRRKNEVK